MDRRQLIMGAPAIVAVRSIMPVKMREWNSPWVEYHAEYTPGIYKCIVGCRARVRLTTFHEMLKYKNLMPRSILPFGFNQTLAYWKFVDGPHEIGEHRRLFYSPAQATLVGSAGDRFSIIVNACKNE